jgi:hypothetical protein
MNENSPSQIPVVGIIITAITGAFSGGFALGKYLSEA